VDQVGSKGSMQLFPEASNKLGPSIGDNCLCNPMQIEDASNIDFCILLSCEASVHGYKVGRLGEAINNHPYRVNLAGSWR
jgi:hypothetical protein